ncbi:MULTISPECIES: hypothetical protein [unclassified Streptomyces]|uniref:hypothetical protein n=1 Tax=unclassified Streptomyces TaxID=2593676 RepID=UPI00381BF903
MDSRITGGPGGRLSDARPADERAPRDATMQLGAFAVELTKPVPVQRTAAPETIRTDTVPNILAAQPGAPAAPLPVVPAQQGGDGPVFVDASGRRGKKVRWLGWIFGLACTGFAVALVGSLLGDGARAPGLTLPDGSKPGAVTPSPKAPTSKAPEPKEPPKESAPPHSASKPPAHKASKPAHSPSGSPSTRHSPTGKTSPSAGSSHKPSALKASPSAGTTRI